MSNFVDNVFNIWKDLEISYAEKGGDLSRKDYLLKLCGITPAGGNKLDLIKASLLKNYEGNEFECDTLTKIFDSISLHWDSIKEVDVIDDLDIYVASLTKTKAPVERVDGHLFTSGLNPYREELVVRTDSVLLVHKSNFITDVFQLKGENIERNFVNLSINKDIITFKGKIWKYSFIETMDTSNKFHMAVYTIISNLRRLEEEHFCVFVDRSRFTYRSDKVNLKYENLRIPLEFIERRKTGDLDYALCEHKNDYVTTPVYCIFT